MDRDVGQPVRVVDVEHGAIVDGSGEIGREPAARRQRDVQREDAPRVVEADIVAVRERVPLAGRAHVVVAVQPKLHRPPGLSREERRDAREERHLRFLAAESAAHAPAFDDDVVIGEAERARDEHLHLARMLRRHVDVQAAALAGDRKRDLAFEIEVVLSATGERAGESMRCARERVRHVAAHDVYRRQHVRLRSQRRVDRQDRRQRRDVQAGEGRRPPRRVDAGRRDGENRLPGEMNDARREDRVVGFDRTDIVDTRDIGGSDDGDHSRSVPDTIEIEALDRAVRMRAYAERGVEGAARLRQVVGVIRFTRDVERRRIVRRGRADDGCRGRPTADAGAFMMTRGRERVDAHRRVRRAGRFQPEAPQQVAEHDAPIAGARAHVVDRRELAGEHLRGALDGRAHPTAGP